MDTIQNNNFFSSENQNQIKPLNFYENSTNNIIQINQNNIEVKQIEKKEKLNSFLEKPIIPNRTFPSFFLNDYLSDALLKFGQNEIPFHKIIISSASDFFLSILKH